MVFVAYTDNSLQMFDMRANNEKHLFRTGGHNCLIKSIYIGNDESVVFTGAIDGTLRLWDVGKRAVIKTYSKNDENSHKKYDFHN